MKKILRSFKGNHKKIYGYMKKLKSVKERVHQIKSDNDQLTTTDEEAAQVLWKFFSSVFMNERDGHNTQSEEEKLIVSTGRRRLEHHNH